MKKIFLLFLFAISASFIFAQDDEADKGLMYEDHVYVDYIRSVKFHIPGIVVSQPMVNLGSGALTFSFDDMQGDVKNYSYSLVHCNADWTPSELSEMEYMDGFNEERIEYAEYSFNTLTNFTHYRVTIPNEDFRFTKSGNYLLKVYDDEDDKFLVVTKRFMVVEPRFIVRAQTVPTSMVSKGRTHQEVNFVVEHKGIRVNSPRQEINVVLMQNGRWDNALKNIKPQFIKGDQLIYDFLDKITFPAGKEFRYFDMRTLRYRADKVKSIERYDDGYDVTLYMDKMRGYSVYYNLRDINGGYVIGNVDDNDGVNVSFSENDGVDVRLAKIDLLRRQMIENEESNNLESDYANVLFSLEMNEPIYDKDVYIFGAMTDWKIKEEFKMTYQNVVNAYVADIFLKQGFYNYMYATVPKRGEKIPDLGELEGNWYETENQYTVLVYYRPFGERYDRLVAGYSFNSDRR